MCSAVDGLVLCFMTDSVAVDEEAAFLSLSAICGASLEQTRRETTLKLGASHHAHRIGYFNSNHVSLVR